ncbi:MAG: ribonuclease Z [Eubacterium sp.]|nr:ribonuclease Z [Eubacterium sp.]
MIDVCLLGTGGMMPLPYRWLTSLYVRYNGKVILIDCGEGTQIAMNKVGLSPKPIDLMCFTHYHADHISGLPGMLLAMGNAERTEPLRMIGPKGLERVVKSLRVIAPELPFQIEFSEFDSPLMTYSFDEIELRAFRVKHNVTCYGYSMHLPRAGRFDTERALEAGIPQKYWSRLQKGEVIEEEGATFTPDMVLGPDRKGIKLTYTTDTRPTQTIADEAEGSDLFICEGMYGEPEKIEKARQYRHMTMYEAARLAKKAQVREMWLTHYSPSLNHPKQYMDEVRKIFPASIAASDGQSVTLGFDNGGEK